MISAYIRKDGYSVRDVREYTKNKIKLSELLEFLEIEEYSELVAVVRELVEDEKLKAIKSSGLNGKRPALYLSYRIIREKEENQEWREELLYLMPKLDPDYYLKNPDKYKKDREYVLLLNDYLMKQADRLETVVSRNERSFEIFHREKYLLNEGGETLLKNLCFPIEQLNIYETSEPIAYYAKHKEVPQTVLFIENKDTFYSMRKYLIEGNEFICGKRIGTIIYGAGKRVNRSLNDFDTSVEPFVLHDKNEYLYFGDLDYEGIVIYEKLYEKLKDVCCIQPFEEAYRKIVEKVSIFDLPRTKEGQNRNLQGIFEQFIDPDLRTKMNQILESGRYIPQECLVSSDFCEEKI